MEQVIIPPQVKREVSFGELTERVKTETLERRPVDRYADLRLFEFSMIDRNRTQLIPFAGMELTEKSNMPTMLLGDIALNQLCQKLGYPVKLLDRLPPACVYRDINWLIQHYLEEDRQALIRTQREQMISGSRYSEARAILGSRYTPIDCYEILELALPFLDNGIVRWEAITDRSAHVSVTWPDAMTDGMIRGVHLGNSEVGLRAVTVEAILYRPVCANILPAVGGRDDGEYDPYKIRNPMNSKQALVGKQKSGWRMIHTGDKTRLEQFIKDGIADAKTSSEAMLAKYRQALDIVVNSVDEIESLSKENKLTQEQFKAVLEAAMEEPISNKAASVVNAFTRAAQWEEDPDERHFIQGIGNQALNRLTAPKN